MSDETNKHPDVIAFEQWLSTDEGIKCATPISKPLEERYLKNRLWCAFKAGISAGPEPTDPKKKGTR